MSHCNSCAVLIWSIRVAVRSTRLSLGFSKKLENLAAAVTVQVSPETMAFDRLFHGLILALVIIAISRRLEDAPLVQPLLPRGGYIEVLPVAHGE